MAEIVTITGWEPLRAKLKALPTKVQRRVVRPAMRDAGKIVLASAKNTVPTGATGNLSRSLRLRAKKRTRKGTIGVNVSAGAAFFRGPTFYGGFVEYGTRKMKGRHFMQAAFDRSSASANAVAMAKIAAGIEREASSK